MIQSALTCICIPLAHASYAICEALIWLGKRRVQWYSQQYWNALFSRSFTSSNGDGLRRKRASQVSHKPKSIITTHMVNAIILLRNNIVYSQWRNVRDHTTFTYAGTQLYSKWVEGMQHKLGKYLDALPNIYTYPSPTSFTNNV